MFSVTILLVVLATATLPLTVSLINGGKSLNGSLPFLPVLAAALFLISYDLPVLTIGQTDTFVQHFVGGGLYTACLFVYFSRQFGWHFSWLMKLVLLFAWVSAFGAANELFELMLNELGLTRINLADTNWDIVANTAGAYVGYLILWISLKIFSTDTDGSS